MDYEYSRPLKYSIDEIEKLLDKISELENEINNLKENGGSGGGVGPTGPQGPAGPKGDKGDPAVNPNFSIGTVETLEADNEAYVRLTGNYPNLVLNFGIPKGKGGSSAPEEPILMYYGRISYEEAGSRVLQFNEITEEMITTARAVKSEEPKTLGKTSLGLYSETAEGDYNIIAVPASCNYNVTKDNGFGGKVAFSESISGSNGIDITIKGIPYKLYGESQMAQGEMFIYIDEVI